MPDLITHSIAAVPISLITKEKIPPVFLIIGSVFPDIISRSILVLFPQNYPLYWVAQALHTPIVLILSIWLVSLFFAPHLRKSAFWGLIIGSFIHLSLDMLQKHYVGGYYWFFPFSYQSFELPLFWPEDLVYATQQLLSKFISIH